MSGRQGRIRVQALRFPDGLRQWHLVAAYLRLRKEVFVDALNWDLYAHNAVEFEQYDHFGATYVIAEDLETGEVVGGARLLPTVSGGAHCTGAVRYSYMIRDAERGLLDGLPVDTSFAAAPVDPAVWELTRLVSRGSARVAQAIITAARDYLVGVGAKRCLFLGPESFLRLARMMGSDAQPMGQVSSNASGRYLAFWCDLQSATAGLPVFVAGRAPHVGAPLRTLNVGRVRELHLAPDGEVIGTTYEWSLTGERVTVWHEEDPPPARQTVQVPERSAALSADLR